MIGVSGCDMWKEIGPPVAKDRIPEEVNKDNHTVKDITTVLYLWVKEFSALYEGIKDGNISYDQQFLEHVQLVSTYEAPSVHEQSNYSFNKCISESEVKKHVQRMKNGKEISVDGIANEIIKNDASIKMLLDFIIYFIVKILYLSFGIEV